MTQLWQSKKREKERREMYTSCSTKLYISNHPWECPYQIIILNQSSVVTTTFYFVLYILMKETLKKTKKTE